MSNKPQPITELTGRGYNSKSSLELAQTKLERIEKLAGNGRLSANEDYLSHLALYFCDIQKYVSETKQAIRNALKGEYDALNEYCTEFECSTSRNFGEVMAYEAASPEEAAELFVNESYFFEDPKVVYVRHAQGKAIKLECSKVWRARRLR